MILGREKIKAALLKRFCDKEHGNKAYRIALYDHNYQLANKILARYKKEMQGDYYMRGANRKVALERGYSIKYDKTALLAVSVFSLSHWRNEVTVKHYMIGGYMDSSI